MAEASRRVDAKPARGGLANAMFIQASLEALGSDLDSHVDRLTVNFPWGSLLRAMALPDVGLLTKLAALAKPRAELDVLVNMQPLRDAVLAARLGLAQAALAQDQSRLRSAYAQAGFAVTAIEDVTGALVCATRWGSQLHFAGREVLRLRAVRDA